VNVALSLTLFLLFVPSQSSFSVVDVSALPGSVLRGTAFRNDRADGFFPHFENVWFRNDGPALFGYPDLFPAGQNLFVDSCGHSLDRIYQLHVRIMHGPFQLDDLSGNSPVLVSLDAPGSHVDALDDDPVQIPEDLLDDSLLASLGVVAPDDLDRVAPDDVPLGFLCGLPELWLGFVEFCGARCDLGETVSGGGRHAGGCCGWDGMEWNGMEWSASPAAVPFRLLVVVVVTVVVVTVVTVVVSWIVWMVRFLLCL